MIDRQIYQDKDNIESYEHKKNEQHILC